MLIRFALALALVPLCLAQRNYGSRTIDGDLIIRNGRLIVNRGTAAPLGSDCDSLSEVGALYVQSGNPGTTVRQLWLCAQTGASTFAWQPASHSSGTTPPATCVIGQTFFDTDASAGNNWLGCTSANTWTLLGGSTPTATLASSTFGAANRVLLAAGASRNVVDSTCTISSGALNCPSGATFGSGLGLAGTCRAASSVSPASGDTELFCDSADGDRLKTKNSGGTVAAYAKVGEGGGGSGATVLFNGPLSGANAVLSQAAPLVSMPQGSGHSVGALYTSLVLGLTMPEAGHSGGEAYTYYLGPFYIAGTVTTTTFVTSYAKTADSNAGNLAMIFEHVCLSSSSNFASPGGITWTASSAQAITMPASQALATYSYTLASNCSSGQWLGVRVKRSGADTADTYTNTISAISAYLATQ